MKKLLNFDYACIHGTFWMFYGVASSFASVFLLANDYTNSEIGMILAAANILAVILQPFAGDLADRTRRISLIGITELMTAMMIIMTAGLFIFKGRSYGLALIFILLIAWHTVLQPLFNSMTFKLEECGIHINFGVARSMGSLAYSALVAVLGTLVEKHGIIVLPVTGEVVLILLMFSILATGVQFNRARAASQMNAAAADVRQDDESGEAEEINLIKFIRRNRMFFILNLGVAGLYFSNSILNNYMMQIVSSVGGNSEDMGRILSLMAFLEIPTMVCFDLLRRKFSCRLMLKVAALGFTAKIALCCIADSVAMILAAQSLQLVSFALFLPAMVHFTDEVISKAEAVKGQALFTTMVTITTVFSSIAGGIILDVGDARLLTGTATAVTAAGAAVFLIVTDKVGKYMSE
ncbi:MAG: MFS transporter [Bacillota bacterium]|nr:MFS transporter [Bacillota bacterium]